MKVGLSFLSLTRLGVAVCVSVGIHLFLAAWPVMRKEQVEPLGWNGRTVTTSIDARFNFSGTPIVGQPAAPSSLVPTGNVGLGAVRRVTRAPEAGADAELALRPMAAHPPRLLSVLQFETTVRPDTGDYVVRFRIVVSPEGTASRIDVHDSWLDEADVQRLKNALSQANYAPARKFGLPVVGVLEGGMALEPQ